LSQGAKLNTYLLFLSDREGKLGRGKGEGRSKSSWTVRRERGRVNRASDRQPIEVNVEGNKEG